MVHVSDHNSGLFNHFIQQRSVSLRLIYQLLQMSPIKRDHVRSKMQCIYQSGMAIKEISRSLKVDRNTVRKWARKDDGDVTDTKRLGRPAKITPKT